MRLASIAAVSLLVVAAKAWSSTTTTGKPDRDVAPGSRGLFFDFSHDEQTNKDTDSYTCPAAGRFAIKKYGRENCRKYIECSQAFKRPSAIKICALHESFNRISRNCIPKKYRNCRWCTKEGRHEDKTSRRHFIDCVGGGVGIRYRCKEGKYDPSIKSCSRHTALRNITDVTYDVDYDPPSNIVEFMRDWKAAERDERKDTGRINRPIESGYDNYPKDDDNDSSEEKGSSAGLDEEIDK